MKRLVVILAVALAAAAGATLAIARPWADTPFPAAAIHGVFVSAETATGAGSSLGQGVVTNFYPRGSTVVFRVFAADSKTGRVLTKEDVKFFYITIPGQPNQKLAYTGQFKYADPVARFPWTASWTIPADYPLGLVPFKVLVKTKAKQSGSFVQIPVGTSQLTVQTA